MILRRMWDGAWKWRLRFFLREEDTNLFSFMAAPGMKKQRTSYNMYQKMMYLVVVIQANGIVLHVSKCSVLTRFSKGQGAI